MSRLAPLVLAALTLAACGSDASSDTTAQREAGQAGSQGTAVGSADDAVVSQTTTDAPAPTSATTTSPASTTPTTIDAPAATSTTTTAPPATTSTTTTLPPPTAPPSTIPPLARCVDGEINLFTEGRRDEIALYQTVLTDLGYDPGEIDGFFGPNTYNAASQEVFDNGNLDGPNGVFEELFPDDGAVLPAAFERLGIACVNDFAIDS